MNFSEIQTIVEDELLRGSKSRYVWIFGGILILLCLLVMHYSAGLVSLFSKSSTVPYSLISYYVVLAAGPFVVLISSFDAISSEVETGSVRYIISKINRSSFVLGKFIFLFIVFALVSSAIAVLSLIYHVTANTFYIENIALLWIFSILYSGCFISIFLFISALSGNNKVSFAMCIVFTGILLFFFFKGDGSYLKYATPFFYGVSNIELLENFSLNTGAARIFQNILSMIIYISVFLSLSLSAIKRRDL